MLRLFVCLLSRFHGEGRSSSRTTRADRRRALPAAATVWAVGRSVDAFWLCLERRELLVGLGSVPPPQHPLQELAVLDRPMCFDHRLDAGVPFLCLATIEFRHTTSLSQTDAPHCPGLHRTKPRWWPYLLSAFSRPSWPADKARTGDA